MKENTNSEENTWLKVFNNLSYGYKLKAREAIFTLLNSATDLATAVPLILTLVPDNNFDNEEIVASMLSSVRRASYSMRDSVKDATIKMVQDCQDSKSHPQIHELFSSNKGSVIKDLFRFDLNLDLKKRMEDLLIACMPRAYKKNHIPDDTTLDYKVRLYNVDIIIYSR